MKTTLVAVFLGCCVHVFSYWVLRDQTVLGDSADQASDLIMRLAEGQSATGVPAAVFVDIDLATYESLGHPAIMPRSVLAAIGASVLAGHPRVLFIDVDLGWRGARVEDELFDQFLTMADASASALLILQNTVSGVAGQRFRATAFDRRVEASDNIHWVISKAKVDLDGVVRMAALHDTGCDENGPVTRPGAALLIQQIIADGGLPDKSTLNRQLQSLGVSCSMDHSPNDSKPLQTNWSIGGKRSVLRARPAQHRIYYSLGGGSAAKNADSGKLLTLSAQRLIDHPELVASEIFRDKVVILGASAPDLNDVHTTPLVARMPGPVIVINEVYSMLRKGIDENTGFWIALLFVALVCFITSLMWHLFSGLIQRYPRVGLVLFQTGGLLLWVPLAVFMRLPALAFTVVMVQATIFFVFHFLMVKTKFDRFEFVSRDTK